MSLVALGGALEAQTTPKLVKPEFLLKYQSTRYLQDYRSAIDASGTTIVFERALPLPDGSNYSMTYNLYIAPIGGTPEPLTNIAGSNRPDWCWSSSTKARANSIIFSSSGGIYYTGPDPKAGGPVTLVRNTAPPPKTPNPLIYPTWFPGCNDFAVDDSTAISYGPNPKSNPPITFNPGPATLKSTIGGAVLRSLSGSKVWAGFMSINPVTPSLVLLAAQPFVEPGYNQDMNYIYVSDTSSTPPRVTPLDPKAPVNNYSPRFQGRAPAWSPDGRWIAFESNRNCADKNFYAIFLQKFQGGSPARQVTDCGFNAQHAKWYRLPQNGRRKLIVSVRLKPDYIGQDALQFYQRGIASLDVTDFLDDAADADRSGAAHN